MQEITKEFVKEFGQEGVNLMCSCWYFNTHAYDFTFHARGIEQINSHTFSIYGDIIDIDDEYLAQTLKPIIVPKKLMDVGIVYNMENRTLRFTKKKSGLVIEVDDNGEDGWRRLLKLVAAAYFSQHI